MNIFEIVGAICMIITSILLVLMIVFQNPKSDAISSIAGAGNSFMDREGDRSLDATLNKFIKVGCVVFFIITVAVYAIGAYL